MPDIADEFPPQFVFRSDLEQWLSGVHPSNVTKKKPTGRPPDPGYDRKDLKEFIYQTIAEKGGWFQDDLPGWQRQADLHKLIRNYVARWGKHPAPSTLYRLVGPILDEWLKEHSSSEN